VSGVESGCVPSNYQPQKCPVLPGGEPVINDYYADAKVRPETYFYHPDHLGSTSWVTDQNARPHERVEYFPYGAVWRDPRSDLGASPQKGQRFLFTGKELDEETGLYYFGARYYDPVHVRWEATDPAFGALLQKHSFALNPYSYARLNPLRFIDPDGRNDDDAVQDAEAQTRSNPAAPLAKAKPWVQGVFEFFFPVQADVATLETGKSFWGERDATDEEMTAAKVGIASTLIGGAAAKWGGDAVRWMGRRAKNIFSWTGARLRAASRFGLRTEKTRLFRAVSEAELMSISETGRLLAGAGQMEGKWFADTLEHAQQWGDKLHPSGFKLIEVTVPEDVANRMFRHERLDGIGPARYGEIEDLADAVIREVAR